MASHSEGYFFQGHEEWQIQILKGGLWKEVKSLVNYMGKTIGVTNGLTQPRIHPLIIFQKKVTSARCVLGSGGHKPKTCICQQRLWYASSYCVISLELLLPIITRLGAGQSPSIRAGSLGSVANYIWGSWQGPFLFCPQFSLLSSGWFYLMITGSLFPVFFT